MSQTLEETRTAETGTGGPTHAHIVRKDHVTRAYVLGEEVEALCGFRWVPSRDPKNYPVCPDCRAIAESMYGGVPAE